jgi:hypothetical protein
MSSSHTRTSRRKPAAQARPKSWRASLIRKRGQILGTVEAPTREKAEAAAVREFNLSDDQRRRLVVQEYV